MVAQALACVFLFALIPIVGIGIRSIGKPGFYSIVSNVFPFLFKLFSIPYDPIKCLVQPQGTHPIAHFIDSTRRSSLHTLENFGKRVVAALRHFKRSCKDMNMVWHDRGGVDEPLFLMPVETGAKNDFALGRCKLPLSESAG